MRQSLRLASLACANILIPIALLVFASGFFPFKPLLPGLATFDEEDDLGLKSGATRHTGAVFDRVIFMVVDALRSDFVYGYNSGFHFTQSLIRSGAALPFTAHASPPTVTMPRVKALTTGSVPSFADLIFNLDESGAGSSLSTQDTWLAQIRARGGKLVFYGDDTWLRLFPGDFFARADGTSSFFVSDFTEVDHNVTRHVPEELASSDWDAMVLHYLGLDHIGHKTGPQGPSMLPKQREMDGIVRLIYEAMEVEPHQEDTLLVLVGDHGMNAGGNHGGSGPGETEPALLFASPKLIHRRRGVFDGERDGYEAPTSPKEGTEFHYHRKIQQSDVVPTLAGLMGLPISKNSLGVFIKEFVGLWQDESRATRLLYRNAMQLRKIVEAAYGEAAFGAQVAWYTESLATSDEVGCKTTASKDEELAFLWAQAHRAMDVAAGKEADEGKTRMVHESLLAFLSAAQDILSSAASTYDIPKMLAGIAITAVALALSLLSLTRLWPPTAGGAYFSLTSLLYGIMMFASSYVEEEQHFWYWLTPAWILLLTITSTSKTPEQSDKVRKAAAGAIMLAVHRIADRWNQTGQKHAGEPDIVHAFFPDHHVLMWMLILMTYGFSCYALTRRSFSSLVPPEVAVAAAVILVLPAVVFKLNFTQADAPELVRGLASVIREWTAPFGLVLQAQITFALLGVATVVVGTLAIALSRSTVLAQRNGPAVRITLAERLHHLMTLFLMTQTRAPNIPLFLGLAMQLEALRILLHPASPQDLSKLRRNANISLPELATSVLLLSHTYYFCMGGSNSISSLDLSNAYNGVADYNVVAVGLLLFTSNWTGPIWWCSAAVVLTFARPVALSATLGRKPDGARSWVEQEREKLREEASASLKQLPASGPTDDGIESWLIYVSCMTAFITAGLLAIMAACTALRTHLFIWTVFSPKYLYAVAWGIGWQVLVNIGLGSLLRWLGQMA